MSSAELAQRVVIKFVQVYFTTCWLCKTAERLANSVDPDLGLHCLLMPICPETVVSFWRKNVYKNVYKYW